MVANSDRVSVSEANRLIKKRRGFVRDLIEQGKLTAWKAGGGKKVVRLEVSIAELQRVLRGEVYVPRGFTRADVARNRRNSPATLHPTALDL